MLADYIRATRDESGDPIGCYGPECGCHAGLGHHAPNLYDEAVHGPIPDSVVRAVPVDRAITQWSIGDAPFEGAIWDHEAGWIDETAEASAAAADVDPAHTLASAPRVRRVVHGTEIEVTLCPPRTAHYALHWPPNVSDDSRFSGRPDDHAIYRHYAHAWRTPPPVRLERDAPSHREVRRTWRRLNRRMAREGRSRAYRRRVRAWLHTCAREGRWTTAPQ